MSYLIWLLSTNMLVLLIAGLGIAVIIGVMKPSNALSFVGLIVLNLVTAPFIAALMLSLPWWIRFGVLFVAGIWALRAVLEVLIGREGAGHVMGHFTLGVLRGLVWIVVLPFRAAASLCRRTV